MTDDCQLGIVTEIRASAIKSQEKFGPAEAATKQPRAGANSALHPLAPRTNKRLGRDCMRPERAMLVIIASVSPS